MPGEREQKVNGSRSVGGASPGDACAVRHARRWVRSGRARGRRLSWRTCHPRPGERHQRHLASQRLARHTWTGPLRARRSAQRAAAGATPALALWHSAACCNRASARLPAAALPAPRRAAARLDAATTPFAAQNQTLGAATSMGRLRLTFAPSRRSAQRTSAARPLATAPARCTGLPSSSGPGTPRCVNCELGHGQPPPSPGHAWSQ
ncbi:hypothetical protein SVAN01_06774 [Stagonosporopsis vannaccii]|nr:hypothetical protein SVAN01_06774 [Stagonosporopsis vannaccii]